MTEAVARREPLDLARRWGWIGLLTLASVGFSRAFACAMPFAALATLAALNMKGREAAALMLVVWIVNQAVGFLLLHYPHTGSTYEWGLAMGVAAFAGLGGAMSAQRWVRAPALAVGAAAFTLAFGLYEAALCANALAVGEGLVDDTPPILAQVFAINALALALLLALDWLAVRARLIPARGRPALA